MSSPKASPGPPPPTSPPENGSPDAASPGAPDSPELLERPPGTAYGALGCGFVGFFSLPYVAIASTSALLSAGVHSKPLIVTLASMLSLPIVAMGIHGLRTGQGATPWVARIGIVLGLLVAVACAMAAQLGIAMSTGAGR
jgi:hypothetical protein